MSNMQPTTTYLPGMSVGDTDTELREGLSARIEASTAYARAVELMKTYG